MQWWTGNNLLLEDFASSSRAIERPEPYALSPNHSVASSAVSPFWYADTPSNLWSEDREEKSTLGGGFKYFFFSPLPGEMIQFD